MATLPFKPNLQPLDPLQDWTRYATAFAISTRSTDTAVETAKALYGASRAPTFAAIHKAAVSPADTATPAWAGVLSGGTRVGPFLRSLRPISAAVRLFEAATRVTFGDGISSYSMPRLTNVFPAPVGVAEGGPIPVVRGDFGSTTIGPPKKLMFIAAMTGELATYSAENAEQIVRAAMEDSAARTLDALVFSTSAATATLPAGLLNGVTPIPATTGGGDNAMTTDIRNLVGAIADAGGTGSPVMVFANLRQAAVLQLRSGANLSFEVIPTTALAAGTIVAIQPEAVVSGFDGLPKIEDGSHAVAHFEDTTTPLQVSTPGAPATVAAPLRSFWQMDLIGLRLLLNAAYGTRGPGFVQIVTGATW